MANVLFTSSTVGMAILPLMIFHQMQMIAAAWLARRYSAEQSGLAAAKAAAADPESA